MSQLTRTLGSVIAPSLASEIHGIRQNPSVPSESNKTRRQIDTRPIQNNNQDQSINNNGAGQTGGPLNVGALPFPQAGFPYQFERSYQYRYPPINPQFVQSVYSGVNGFGNLPLDPRFFQFQNNQRPVGNLGQVGTPNVQTDSAKQVTSNSDSNVSSNVKVLSLAR